MKKILFLVALLLPLLILTGCSSPAKKEFVKKCLSENMLSTEAYCECIYDEGWQYTQQAATYCGKKTFSSLFGG